MPELQEASALVLIPPPIQGLGRFGRLPDADGADRWQLRLQPACSKQADAVVAAAKADPAIQTAFTPFRAQVPQIAVKVDRSQAETLGVAVGDVFDTLQSYLGTTYINLFTRFGHNFMVFAQADAKQRLTADDIKQLLGAQPERPDGPVGHTGRHQEPPRARR